MAKTENTYSPRLWEEYKSTIVPKLQEEFGYKNKMAVPGVKKVTINMGLGDAVANPNLIKSAVEEMTQITGQRAIVCRAKQAISNFKLREGMPIGVSVTLRKKHMWEFLDRLISVAMPRIRDFKGISPKAFDGRGNYNLGLKEQIIFPEINYDNVDEIKGMNITIVTSADNNAEGKALLKHLGMPFRD